MKVVHFSTSDLHGGAAKAAYRLHCALRDEGHVSRMVVRDKLSDDGDVVSASPRPNVVLFRRLQARLAAEFGRHRTKDFNLDLTPAVSLEPALQVVGEQADVLCLHWITGLLSVRGIASLAMRFGCPVVWMLTDQEPYTGGCHYSYECDKYKSRCGCCPQIYASGPSDRSALVWRRKYQHLTSLPLSFVSSCSWTTSKIRESSLFSRHRVEEIGDPIDDGTFRWLDRKVARNLLHVPIDAKIIFFGAFSLDNPRKGMTHLVAALHLLADFAAASEKANIFLLCAGHNPTRLIADLSYPFRSLGYVRDDLMLALAYQAADLFVSPSIYEAGSMMIPEAMLCGTPVVAFDTGNAQDLIRGGQTGYLARNGESGDLARGIWSVLTSPNLSAMSDAARKAAHNRHATSLVARKHIRLYEELSSVRLEQRSRSFRESESKGKRG